MQPNPDYYCVIMAGGIGSRFWPMSRTAYPKQFHDVLGIGKTLIQLTFDRFAALCPPENIFVVTNTQYVDQVAEQLPAIKKEHILAEPSRRNTAPCIAYAAHKIASLNPKAQMVVAPSDHLVMKEEEFTRIIRKAYELAASGEELVTLGIRPTRPDTGYGYIQFDDAFVNDDAEIRKVKTFTEKPDLEIAKELLKDGSFYWNSGIFIWSVSTILNALDTYLPDINNLFLEGTELYNTDKEQDFINRIYPVCENESIDYGVMEKAGKADKVNVVLSDFGWSDIGTWGSLYTHLDQDKMGNAHLGKQVSYYGASNNMVKTPEDKLVVIEGLDDYIVVDTDDVLLICRKEKEQDIKKMVNDIRHNKGDRFI